MRRSPDVMQPARCCHRGTEAEKRDDPTAGWSNRLIKPSCQRFKHPIDDDVPGSRMASGSSFSRSDALPAATSCLPVLCSVRRRTYGASCYRGCAGPDPGEIVEVAKGGNNSGRLDLVWHGLENQAALFRRLKRSIRKGAGSTQGVDPITRSAISAPAPGPIPKP